MAALASSTEAQSTSFHVVKAGLSQQTVSRSAIPPTTGSSSAAENWAVEKARLARRTVDFQKIYLEGDVETVQKLLTDPKFDLSTYDICWHSLIKKDHTSILRLLLADQRSDPNDYSLEEWVMKNEVADVELLVKHERFKPKNSPYELTLWACKNNHPDILATLLANPEVEYPNGLEPSLLNAACKHGHLDIVKILLSDHRCQPTNDAFFHASHFGWADIVQYLLPKVDPAADDNIAICSAGNAQVASVLLSDPRVDPTAKNSDSLFQAAVHGKEDVVRVLLDDGRADPEGNYCLIWAHGAHHHSVVDLLLTDVRVNPRQHATYEDWFRDPHRMGIQNLVMPDDLDPH